mgnify:FL=1
MTTNQTKTLAQKEQEIKDSLQNVMNQKTLNEAIASIRVKLQKADLRKTGKNKFVGFEYFELADFLPTLNELMEKEGVNDLFTIEENKAILTLIKGEEKQSYMIPFIMFETPLNIKGAKSMQDIQYLGALNTYYKRYLYLNAFGITDGDVIDALDVEGNGAKKAPAQASAQAKVVNPAPKPAQAPAKTAVPAKPAPAVQPATGEKLASEKQLELISNLYTQEEISTMLARMGLTGLSEVTLSQASKMIEARKKA